jgi:DNA-binding transcriptional MerR regulator
MFTIGDFARLGRVSVRMLRHYDAIGLLRPAAVDPASGYRFYRADQLGRLNRVVALKELGFTLEQVQVILDGQVSAEELRGMLRLRRAQLEAQLAADANRLAGVEARLRMIESEGHMNTEDIVVKPVAPVRVAELTAVAASYAGEHIAAVIQPLYPELIDRMEAAGVQPVGPAIAYYEPATAQPGEPGDEVLVHAAMPVTVDPHPSYGFAVVDVPGIQSAATIIHRGDMAEVEASIQALARWIDDNGYRTDGYAREVYLEYCPDERDKGVTELQLALVKQ